MSSIELKDKPEPIDGAEYTNVCTEAEINEADINDKRQEKNEGKEAFSVGSLWAAVVKQLDQMSPLLLKKMPVVVILLILFILAGSYLGAFFYQIEQMFALCTEENNCISCALTIEEVDGATCDRLAVTNLNVAAGCTSIPMGNDYPTIRAVLDGINATIESKKGTFTDDFYDSLVKHGGIADTLQGNALNQMIDPDLTKLRPFLDANYFGLSDALVRTSLLDDDVVTSVGIKVLYSYISIGCAIFSADGFSTSTYGGHPYTEISICGCSLFCPANNLKTIGGTVDISINSASVASQGLSDLNLFLPDNYVQYVDVADDVSNPSINDIIDVGTSNEDDTPSFIDEIAVVEMQYKDATSSALRHCPTSVFTQTPAKLNGALYQCCTEKNVIEKLSEVSAFASLMLTFAIIVTTVIFYPLGPDDKGIQEELKEMVNGAME